MHAMFMLCACVFTAQCRLGATVVSVLLFPARLCCSSPNQITKQFQPHPQQPWTLYIKFQSSVTKKSLYALIPSQSNVFIHVVQLWPLTDLCERTWNIYCTYFSSLHSAPTLQLFGSVLCAHPMLHVTTWHSYVFLQCQNSVLLYECGSILWSPTWFFHMICVCILVHVSPFDGNINTCNMMVT